MDAHKKSSETTIPKLENWVAKKEGMLAKKQAWLAKVKAWLAETRDLLRSIEEKAIIAEVVATSTTAQVVEEYKNLEAFKEDVAKARVGAYSIGFEDYKAKVAWAHPKLDLSDVVADGATLEKGGREEGGAKVAEMPKLEVTMVDPAAIEVEVLVAATGVDT